MCFSLSAWINPRNMEMNFSHRGLSSQKRWFTVSECGFTHKLLYIAVLKIVCMYVSGICDIISASHPLYSLLQRWNILPHRTAFLLSHRTISTCGWMMDFLQVTSWINVLIYSYFTIAHFCFMTAHLNVPIALTPDRDSVKPEPQLCMNENNNP